MAKPPSREELEARIGDVVKSRYRLVSLVGVGGQGAVYRAEDSRDGDAVAVKVLHERVDRDWASRERLSREAHALMALDGTSAVRVFDQGFTNDGRFCLVTELLVGEDLHDALVRMEASQLVFRVADLPFVFEPLVATLTRAHALDIIHRDLKPENVFLQQIDGASRVRLMDFGFARMTRMTRLTMEGFIAGSPSYIPPEIWLEREATASADVYSLGAMMFRVLAGKAPFPGETTMQIYRQATGGQRPSLHVLRPDLPKDVDDWVKMALAIDPEERFRTPRASYSALCSVLGLGS